MNTGAFGEGFPYSNFHELNMDWIIKIAKDFLDQYTHIQEIITSGEQEIDNLTTLKLEELQTKADELETLLQQWYDTHSADIATQLTQAISSFTVEANRVAQEAIESIPSDYTELSDSVLHLQSALYRNSKFLGQDTYFNRLRTHYTTSEGWKLDSTGLAVRDDNYHLLKFLVSEGSMFRIVSDNYFQFQITDSASSTTSSAIEKTYGQGEFVIIAPPTSNYLIVSTPITGSNVSVYEYFNDFSSIKEAEINTHLYKDYCISELLELGDLYVNDNHEGFFSDALKRVRILEGMPIHLNKNDIIYLSDSTQAVFVLYRYENGQYINESAGWQSDPVDIRTEGDYYLVGKYPAEAIISNPDAFMKLFYIKRFTTLQQTEENEFSLKENMNSFNYGTNNIYTTFEMGDFYVDSEGNGTYFDAIKRIRTIQGFPLHLRKGDIISISNSNYVFNVYKNEPDNKYSVYKSTSNSPVMIDTEGDYQIVARYATESRITNFYEIASSIVLTRIEGVNLKNHNEYGVSDLFYNELQETISTVKNTTLGRGLLIGIITDTHIDRPHAAWYDNTIENLNRIADNIPLNGIMHLGDFANAYQETKERVEFDLKYGMTKLLSINKSPTYIMLGNHDDNHFSGTSEMIPDKEMYSITQRFNENYVIRTLACATDTENEYRSSNYYRDYPGLKLRIICFDSTYQHTGFSTPMINWMRTVFETAPSDYKFALFTHCGFTIDLNGGYGLANGETFTALLNEYRTRICCYVCGHAHCDFVSYPLGFAQIALCCAVPDQPATNPPEGAIVPDREIGTVSEVCISIINIMPENNTVQLIRYGAGSDRTIPMTN